MRAKPRDLGYGAGRRFPRGVRCFAALPGFTRLARKTRSYSVARDGGSGGAAGAFQVDGGQGHGGGGEAGDAARRAGGFRAYAVERLLLFGGQAAHLGVVKGAGYRRACVALLAGDVVALALQVAGVLG